MTARQAAELRDLVARARLERELADDLTPRCRSCGCERSNYTTGCAACDDRRRRREKRKDPAYRDVDAARGRAYRARQRDRGYKDGLAGVEPQGTSTSYRWAYQRGRKEVAA